MGDGSDAYGAAGGCKEGGVMGYEMDMEDYLVAAKRKLAVVEQQNQDLREVNSRLTLALDEALGIVRLYQAERRGDMEGHEL